MQTLIQGVSGQVVHLAGSLVNRNTGARLTTGATARVSVDGTWGSGAGTLAIEETDQWKYTLHDDEADARELVVTVDHTDAVEPIVETITLLDEIAYSHQVQGSVRPQLYYVAKTGSDSNSGLSWAEAKLTCGAAKTAAGTGAEIHVGPGTYDEKNLLKNLVDWHFEPGAIVNYSSGGSDGGIWDDTADGANSACTSRVRGNGRFIVSNGGLNSYPVQIANSSSRIYIDGEEIDGIGADPPSAVLTANGAYVHVRAKELRGVSYTLDAADGNIFCEADFIEGYVESSGDALLHVKAKYIKAHASDPHKAVNVVGSGARCIIEGAILESESDGDEAVVQNDANGSYVLLNNCQIVNAGTGKDLDSASSQNVFVSGTLYNAGNVGANVVLPVTSRATTVLGNVTGDVGGKLLGGGTGTITGTGARVVDASGNAIAPAATALSTATWTGTLAGYIGNLNTGVPLADGAITANKIASGALTAAKFASGAFDAVWSATTRLLTAGTNIVLAKGTGVTGFNDPTVSAITADIDANSTKLTTISAKTNQLVFFEDPPDGGQWQVMATLPSQIQENIAALTTQEMDAASTKLANLDATISSRLASGSYAAPPTAIQNADAVAAQADIAAALQTIDTNLDAKVSDVEGGSGTPRPVNQVPVPNSRTWTLKPTDDGLQGELPLSTTLGDTGKVWAIDFRHDMANNGRLLSVDAVTLLTGTVGGITFGNNIDDVDDYGVDRSQAKVRIGLAIAGTYTFQVNVTYDDADGGGTSQGEVKLIVK